MDTEETYTAENLLMQSKNILSNGGVGRLKEDPNISGFHWSLQTWGWEKWVNMP
jgi:hypothetical protein